MTEADIETVLSALEADAATWDGLGWPAWKDRARTLQNALTDAAGESWAAAKWDRLRTAMDTLNALSAHPNFELPPA